MTGALLEIPLRSPLPAPQPWLRNADVELVDVSFPERTIELIVIPYDVEAEVRHPTKPHGPPVREVIGRGAFDGIERRANRVKANRDHDMTRIFGHATAFHPGDQAGLRGKIRVARSDLGQETLELAVNGDLDVSAGFWPDPDGGLRWETRDRYRIAKAFLHHIALVGDGAYGEDARVLSVRAATPAVGERPPMPNRQRVDLQRWLDREAQINSRYS